MGEQRLRGDRLANVEIMRGLAAMAVAWFHFTNGGGLIPEGWLKGSGGYGWIGVDIFFVISGFIIPYSMYRAGFRFPGDCGRFMLKRIVRLEPPYLLTIALVIVLGYASAITPGFQGSAPDVSIPAVLLHLGYLVELFGLHWLNPVFWSLAIEFQFYLMAALAFPLLEHRSRYVRWLFLCAFCWLPHLVPGSFFLFHFAGLFAFGILTFHRATGLNGTRDYLLAMMVVAALSFPILETPVIAAGFLTAMVIAFAENLPQSTPLGFLGAVSYSVYLLHVPIGGRVVNLGTRFADTLVLQLLVLAMALATTLLAAYALHRFVERPSRRWSSSIQYGGAPRPHLTRA